MKDESAEEAESVSASACCPAPGMSHRLQAAAYVKVKALANY